MCEDINIATLSSSTWLVFTHGAVATNETGWSVPTVGLTFDDLQQNLTYVALALQRSQAHFTQPLLWVRPAGQLPQTTTRQLTSFFGNILVPRSWYQDHTPITKKHLKKRYPGGNFQSSDPTWSPRSPCKSIISARAPPWQGKHSKMIWPKRWKHAWQKKWLWSLSIFDVTVMSLANFWMVSFFNLQSNPAPRHLRPQHLVSHPQDVFNRFSKKDSERINRKKKNRPWPQRWWTKNSPGHTLISTKYKD